MFNIFYNIFVQIFFIVSPIVFNNQLNIFNFNRKSESIAPFKVYCFFYFFFFFLLSLLAIFWRTLNV